MNDKDTVLASESVQYFTLLEEKNYAVTKTLVLPGGETKWHHHTNVYDRLIVVKGTLTVEINDGNVIKKIEVRDYYSVDLGLLHHVKNETSEDVEYIMVQSGGSRDIVIGTA